MATPRQQEVKRFLADLGFGMRYNLSETGNQLIRTTTVVGQIDQFKAYDAVEALADVRTPFGFYSDHTINSDPGFDTLSVTFQDIRLGAGGVAARYNLATRMLNRPIEEHPNYKAIWNHHIIGPPGTVIDNTEYGYWAAKTEPTPPAGATADVVWIKSAQALPTSLAVVLVNDSPQFYAAATKPGINAYLVPSPVVLATIYTRSEVIMENYAALGGELIAPGKTYNYQTANNYWLATAPTTRKQNDWYEITVEYMYSADGWDTEVY